MRKILAGLVLSACIATGTSLSAEAVEIDNTGEAVSVKTVSSSRGGASVNATPGWSWGGPTVFFNKRETKSARGIAGAAALCGLVPGIPPFKVLCGLNVAAIKNHATYAYNKNRCLLVLVTPGGLIPSSYTGKQCK